MHPCSDLRHVTAPYKLSYGRYGIILLIIYLFIIYYIIYYFPPILAYKAQTRLAQFVVDCCGFCTAFNLLYICCGLVDLLRIVVECGLLLICRKLLWISSTTDPQLTTNQTSGVLSLTKAHI